MSISVAINKSPIPIIWLDTSVITKATQYKMGVNLSEIDRTRIASLYARVKQATRKAKLLCPMANQDEEVWANREIWLDTIDELSFGISTETYQGIKDRQFHVFAEAYCLNKDEVVLSYRDIFHQDPVEELKDILSKPYRVRVDPPLIGGEEYHKQLKEDIFRGIEKLRQDNVENGVTFDQCLEKEYWADLVQLREMLSVDFEQVDDLHERDNYFWGHIGAMATINDWVEVSFRSGRKDINILDFYASSHYREMPFRKLSAEFFAMLCSDKQPIRSGDIKDVEHICTILPFVDMFVTDKQRSAQLRSRGYDSLYNTIVCYMGDDAKINNFFDVIL